MFMKKKAVCIIVFGLSGVGKSTLSKLIFNKVQKKIGKTVLLDGNEIREFFTSLGQDYGFSKRERSKTAKPVLHLINLFLKQNVNVIYNNVCLNKTAYNTWKKGINNLIYIYIKSDVNKIIKFGKKKNVYSLKKDVVGLHIKPDIPKRPDIIVENYFNRPLRTIVKELLFKLNKLI